MRRRIKGKRRGFAMTLAVLVLLLGFSGLLMNWRVKHVASPWIVTESEAAELTADCILVLGAGVRGETPSLMLQARLDTGIALYESGVSDRILMSGDHGNVDYDEVNVMKRYAISAGVPSSHIFMDHAGFSTYDSMARANEIFLAQTVIIVTQEYHLYRAVYVARAMGLNAYGVACGGQDYAWQMVRDAREMVARTKDCIMAWLRPAPTLLGTPIPIMGDGDVTNDRD